MLYAVVYAEATSVGDQLKGMQNAEISGCRCCRWLN